MQNVVPPAAVAETHSAVVVFIGDRAYKLKKPVDLGFLDFRSREARESICHEEVALNRRLAPDVYLGVADLHGADGEVCDHLVVMRRMPSDRRLSALVRAGEPVDHHLWHIAHRLAAFHASCPRRRDADEAAGCDATRRRWDTNTDLLVAEVGHLFDDVTVGLVHGLACRYLDGRGALFDHRVAAGRAVDGHGDLLADDIFCLDDGPRILDCIEFDAALRVGDGLADAAFLAMDLEHLGRPDLGQRFLDAYREHRGDVWPASLAHHYIAYRAQVRAKVNAIRASQGDPTAGEDAVALLRLAASHLEAGRVRLVLVGGLPGTGKSTLASGLADELGAVMLRSDVVRKQLAGLTPEAPAPAGFREGIYTADATAGTYRTLLDTAATGLGMGETVVVDASWTSGASRAQARAVASAAFADLVELRCEAPAAIASARILERVHGRADVSDATPAIADAMRALQDEWPEAIPVDTSGAVSSALADALSRVQRVAFNP